jgi:murein DD-endopeptidase MepM/ murein hydrolase activator NlpD
MGWVTVIEKRFLSFLASVSAAFKKLPPTVTIAVMAISLSTLPPVVLSPIGFGAHELLPRPSAHAEPELSRSALLRPGEARIEFLTETAPGDVASAQSPEPRHAAVHEAPPDVIPEPPPAAPVQEPFSLVWPTSGPISQYMGPQHPKGIDIGLLWTQDRPIVAADSGVVVFAGGSRCCDYGLHVIIEHREGFSTLYSHLDWLDVYEGQHVHRGQFIGWGGDTGISTGPHLHFELMHEGIHIDPIPFLPPHVLPEPFRR